jgi:hypothetical protein
VSSWEIPLGASVLVKSQLYSELVGKIGTVTNSYGHPEHLANEVELADDRKILFWHYQLEQVRD